jgi:hypothetical protein
MLQAWALLKAAVPDTRLSPSVQPEVPAKLLNAQDLWFCSLLKSLITTFQRPPILHELCSRFDSLHNTARALVRLGVGVMVLATSHLLDLPADLQRLILQTVPLREMARLACLSTGLRSAYLDRVKERDAAIAALRKSHFTAGFSDGLSSAETALPRDLIVLPQVRGSPSVRPAQVLTADGMCHVRAPHSSRMFSRRSSRIMS